MSEAKAPAAPLEARPDLRFAALKAMCDDTGLFQHAAHSVPDRDHGYCVDDNARALLLSCALNGAGEALLPDRLTTRFASFVQHAWNPDRGRFRNFMGFDRRWLEEVGSEDSHARTLWALGVCARDDPNRLRRRWAEDLFVAALVPVEAFSSPRSWAFTLLGLDAYCAVAPAGAPAGAMRRRLADRLCDLLRVAGRADWVWFEPALAYDNARLCEALLVVGQSLKEDTYVAAGLRTLDWLTALQTAPSGAFRPVGTESFGALYTAPKAFDQQPIEAAAAIAAAYAAWRSDNASRWRAEAERAFTWFFGANDLGLALVNPADGGCCDGLHPDRVNLNRGGESLVSFLLSAIDMRRFAKTRVDRPRLALSSEASAHP